MDARQSGLRPRPRLGPPDRRLAGRDSREHAGAPLLRRDRRAVLRQQLQLARALRARTAIATSTNVKFNPNNFINAALAGIGDGHNGGGPIWAIFDAEAVAREKWDPAPPNVDVDAGFFFSADTIAGLARGIEMKYQRVSMPPANLEATVARYNGFVDAGEDADFAKPKPLYKIARPPFHAAWSTPVVHDTRAGLRIDAAPPGGGHEGRDHSREVLRGGESAGGFSEHGLARATCQGYIAGRNAAAEPAG